ADQSAAQWIGSGRGGCEPKGLRWADSFNYSRPARGYCGGRWQHPCGTESAARPKALYTSLSDPHGKTRCQDSNVSGRGVGRVGRCKSTHSENGDRSRHDSDSAWHTSKAVQSSLAQRGASGCRGKANCVSTRATGEAHPNRPRRGLPIALETGKTRVGSGAD